jgi:hypothetical protein
LTSADPERMAGAEKAVVGGVAFGKEGVEKFMLSASP